MDWTNRLTEFLDYTSRQALKFAATLSEPFFEALSLIIVGLVVTTFTARLAGYTYRKQRLFDRRLETYTETLRLLIKHFEEITDIVRTFKK